VAERQCRRFGVQALDDERIELLRNREILEGVLPEIPESDTFGKLVVHEIRSPRRQNHVPAPRCSHDSCCSVDVEPGVEPVGLHRLAGVEADTHPDRLRFPLVLVQCALHRGGCGNSFTCDGKAK
jgi:hypothetical protein